jgi:hypothetical protein
MKNILLIKDIERFNMLITKKILIDKFQLYLNQQITLNEFVDWAENSIMEDDFAENDFDLIKEIISKIALADVKHFGLSWEDCEKFIKQLGFKVKLEFEYV